jgi:hypothetical protein
MKKSSLFMAITIISEIIGFIFFFLIDLDSPNAIYMIYLTIFFLGIGVINQILMMVFKYIIEPKLDLSNYFLRIFRNWNKDATIQSILIPALIGFLWYLMLKSGFDTWWGITLLIIGTLFALWLLIITLADDTCNPNILRGKDK